MASGRPAELKADDTDQTVLQTNIQNLLDWTMSEDYMAYFGSENKSVDNILEELASQSYIYFSSITVSVRQPAESKAVKTPQDTDQTVLPANLQILPDLTIPEDTKPFFKDWRHGSDRLDYLIQNALRSSNILFQSSCLSVHPSGTGLLSSF